MQPAALISVSDKSNLTTFAKDLSDLGYVILSTSGSKKALEAAGIPCVAIEDYTGQKEILDGRVKTLHPKIHAGILADRAKPEHVAQLAADKIHAIDLVIVNLYPFQQGLKSDTAAHPQKMVELIDIGGPTMIRAAAKNIGSVLPVCDPADYARVTAALRERVQAGTAVADAARSIPLALRRDLMVKVFSGMAEYDLAIAKYFSGVAIGDTTESFAAITRDLSQTSLSPVNGIVGTQTQTLRYGENPHQQAGLYSNLPAGERGWKQLQGKELSYNNLLDFDAMFRLMRSFPCNQAGAAIIKHLNPCGAALASSLEEALHLAKKGDPRSHFGGIIGFTQEVDASAAQAVAEDFAEIVVAPKFTSQALEAFSKKKNLRVIEVDLERALEAEVRTVLGGFLVQEADPQVCQLSAAQVVSSRHPTAVELQSLQFAWMLCAHVKSNAIVLVHDRMLVGAGAGQMSRIDSVEISVSKALMHGNPLQGAVAASDAFFPFPDSIQHLAKQGIKAVVAPSGSKRDEEVIATANELGLALLFTNERHFKH